MRIWRLEFLSEVFSSPASAPSFTSVPFGVSLRGAMFLIHALNEWPGLIFLKHPDV